MSFSCSSALHAPGSALEEKRQNKYGLWQGLLAYCHIRTVTLQAGKLVQHTKGMVLAEYTKP